jgi:hypothetical protein
MRKIIEFEDESVALPSEDERDFTKEDELREISGIIVTGSDWTVETIVGQIEKGNIELSPRFQRRDAWTIERKSRFIESLILGFPTPHIVLASEKNSKGKYVVLDGKQRLLAIYQFWGGYSETSQMGQGFKLKGVDFRKDLNGKNKQDLGEDSEDLVALENQTIRTSVIKNWKTEKFLHKVFLRFNIESTPLSSQELRQALHPGEFINYLDDHSAVSSALQKIFKSDSPDFRMRDVEILLRFFAFHYFLKDYRGDLQSFLDQACERLNTTWEFQSLEIKMLVGEFEHAVNAVVAIFGEKDFCKTINPETGEFRSQFNRSVLDSMAFYFSNPTIREEAIKKKDLVKHSFKDNYINDSRFRESFLRNTKTIESTYNRLHIWGEALKEITGLEFNIPDFNPENKSIIFNETLFPSS